MPIAIHTKYIGPTDTKGARISATCRRDRDTKYRVEISFPHELSCEDRHAMAARRLIEKHFSGLTDKTFHVCGNTLDNLGYVFAIGAELQSTAEKLAPEIARDWTGAPLVYRIPGLGRFSSSMV